MKARTVARETLDELAEQDPAAMRARRDLHRVHRAMGTQTLFLRVLRQMNGTRHGAAGLRVLELGAGDGNLLLGIAQALAPAWSNVELTLLDAQALVRPDTVARFARFGWTAVAQVQDVFDWASDYQDPRRMDGAAQRWDLIVANLFLHHFEDNHLAGLLHAIAQRADRFFASEPRRGALALVGSHLVGLLGANWVTRRDAVLSVHAGFRGQELSALWPETAHRWQLREYRGGPFSHCFLAQSIESH